jgi:hypothetical protein
MSREIRLRGGYIVGMEQSKMKRPVETINPLVGANTFDL